MSLGELKDEFKQSEGDPAVKGKMKQIRNTRQRRRMIATMPKAAVVVTNPTHYAVALQYERGMDASLCVANTPSRSWKIHHWRALHASVEVDQMIQPEHYKAMAELIGYVMRLRRAFPLIDEVAAPRPRVSGDGLHRAMCADDQEATMDRAWLLREAGGLRH